LKRPQRPLPRLVGKKPRTIKQWATFVPLRRPRRPSVHLLAFEEEVVARKVSQLVTWKQRPVTAKEVMVANPGLFHPHRLEPVMQRVRHVNRYTERAAA
jgi:hypothetical protein